MATVAVYFGLAMFNLVVHGLPIENEARDAPNDGFSGEMIGGNFEGDMIMSDEQLQNLDFGPRNGLVHKKFRWPKNSKGEVIVPYNFTNADDYSELNKTEI